MASISSIVALLSLFSLSLANCNLRRWCVYGRGQKVASWRCARDATILVDIGHGGKILQVTRCNDCYFLVEQHKVRFGSNYYRIKMFHNNGRLRDITSGRFLAKCAHHTWPLGVGGAGSHDFKVNIGGKLKGGSSVTSAELSVGVETTLTSHQKRFSITWPDGAVSNCGARMCRCSGPYRCYV